MKLDNCHWNNTIYNIYSCFKHLNLTKCINESMKRNIREKKENKLTTRRIVSMFTVDQKRTTTHFKVYISSNPVTRASCFTFPVDWTRPGRSLRVRTRWRVNFAPSFRVSLRRYNMSRTLFRSIYWLISYLLDRAANFQFTRRWLTRPLTARVCHDVKRLDVISNLIGSGLN